MKMKMKGRSHRYDINRHRSRHGPAHGHKYSKYKKCVIMRMLICIKSLSHTYETAIYEKVKHGG